MGQVITFYSYKGGVGRSMSLANVAVVLSKWGFKTLMIDWDLEAPGLENFFREYLDVSEVAQQEGVLEYLISTQDSPSPVNWRSYLTKFQVPKGKTPLHLMTAGRRDANYFKRLREFDISRFYGEHGGGKIIEQLRDDLKEHYDFVLVDSRTGVTDVGGICTIQLPDMLVLLFTPTEQGLNGIKFIADSALKGQQNMPSNRTRLLILPVPCRIDSSTEFKISKEWTDRFADELTPYYDDWLPAAIEKRRFIEHIKLPYISYFSYGEKLPIIEQGTDDKGGLGFALEGLAALLANSLEDAKMFMEERDKYMRQFKKNGNGALGKVDQAVTVEDFDQYRYDKTSQTVASTLRFSIIFFSVFVILASLAAYFWNSSNKREEERKTREENLALGDAQALGQNLDQSKVSYGIALTYARNPEDSARLNARLGLVKAFETIEFMEKYGAAQPSGMESARLALQASRQELKQRDITAKSLDSLAERYLFRLGEIASESELFKARQLIKEGDRLFKDGYNLSALLKYEEVSNSFSSILPLLIQGDEGAVVTKNLTLMKKRPENQLMIVNGKLTDLAVQEVELLALLEKAGQGGIGDKTRYQTLQGQRIKLAKQQAQEQKSRDALQSMINRYDRLLAIWDK